MHLIKCTIKLILTWSDKCVLSNDTKSTAFAITDTKLYVANVTLSTQDNTKLLRQLKSGFKITINWNKYQSKVSILNWPKFSESKYSFRFTVWKYYR